jgi:NAD-dependent aldehyde dehydrogenases
VTGPAELDETLQQTTLAADSFMFSAPDVRAELLAALARALELRATELLGIASAETCLSSDRLAAELARTSNQLRLFADVVSDGAFLEVITDRADASAARPSLARWLEPLGPTLVFAASNFPFAFSVLGGDTASALAAGCPVVVKAHDGHPGLSMRVSELAADIVQEHGIPPGVLSVIFGVEAGVNALRDVRIKAAGFTGSTKGGRHLFDVASGRRDPIPFYGELGSINPVVITSAALDARGMEIVRGFVESMTLSAGQFCTKPGLVFLPSGHALEPELAQLLSQQHPAAMLSRKMRTALDAEVATLIRTTDARTVGAGSPAPADGTWFTPVVFATDIAGLLANAQPLTREYFGSVSIIVEYDDLHDVIAALELIEGSLTATVHAEPEDAPNLGPLLAAMSRTVGRVIYNGWPTGVAVTWSMQHGGPWPATTASIHTSVGATSIRRWQRPVCYQGLPDSLLPVGLRTTNPWTVPRRIDGKMILA